MSIDLNKHSLTDGPGRTTENVDVAVDYSGALSRRNLRDIIWRFSPDGDAYKVSFLPEIVPEEGDDPLEYWCTLLRPCYPHQAGKHGPIPPVWDRSLLNKELLEKTTRIEVTSTEAKQDIFPFYRRGTLTDQIRSANLDRKPIDEDRLKERIAKLACQNQYKTRTKTEVPTYVEPPQTKSEKRSAKREIRHARLARAALIEGGYTAAHFDNTEDDESEEYEVVREVVESLGITTRYSAVHVDLVTDKVRRHYKEQIPNITRVALGKLVRRSQALLPMVVADYTRNRLAIARNEEYIEAESLRDGLVRGVLPGQPLLSVLRGSSGLIDAWERIGLWRARRGPAAQ